MSGLDAVARGMAQRGIARAVGAPLVLASSATPVPVYNGGSTGVWMTVASIPLPAGSIAPDSVIEVTGLIGFSAPAHAGRAVRLTIGGVSVGQSFPTAAIMALNFIHRLHVAPDRQSVATMSQNLNTILSPADGQGGSYRAQAAAPAVLAVDLSVAQVLAIQVQPINADSVTLQGFEVRTSAMAVPANYAPAKAIAAWGHSLTAGTGDATVAGGWVERLRQADPGRPVFNGGVGGQTAVQIVNRLIADKVRGRYWTVMLDLARNNVGSATMVADVMAQITRAKAALAPGTRLIVATCTPASGETAGSANGTQIAAFNTALKARGDVLVLDTAAALIDQADGTIGSARMSDAVHWNATGHGLVQVAAKALLDANGL